MVRLKTMHKQPATSQSKDQPLFMVALSPKPIQFDALNRVVTVKPQAVSRKGCGWENNFVLVT
jgi:hypothetical protein